jgi:hypothetical protein
MISVFLIHQIHHGGERIPLDPLQSGLNAVNAAAEVPGQFVA